MTARGGSGMAMVIVRLADWSDRSTSQQEVMADVNVKMGTIPGLTTFLRSSNSLNIRGGGGGGLEFAVAGQDRAVLEDAAATLLAAMHLDPAFLAPQLSSDQVQPVLELETDREAEIASTLKRSLGESRAGTKIVASWTCANEKTVKNWFAGRYGPRAPGRSGAKLRRGAGYVPGDGRA